MRKSARESRWSKLLRMKDVRSLEVPVFPDRDGGSNFPLAYTNSGAQEEGRTMPRRVHALRRAGRSQRSS